MTEHNSTKIVDEIGKLNFEGNIIPHSWYKSITITTPKGTVKPDTIGIILLSDIIYWYRPTIIRDEATGSITNIKKKFKADKLQRSYDQLSEQFGFSKRQVRDAIHRLKDNHLIEIEFRNLKVNGVDINNVLYIEPIPESIDQMTFPHTYDEKKYTLSRKKVIGGTKNRGTNTEITTKNTTDIKRVDGKTPSALSEEKSIPFKEPLTAVLDDVPPKLVKPNKEGDGMDVSHLSKGSKKRDKLTQKFGEKNIAALVQDCNTKKERVISQKPNDTKERSSPRSSTGIIARFQELYKDFFGKTYPLVEIKHKKLLKRMIEAYGYDYVEAMLVEMFVNWSEFRRLHTIHSVPNISLLYGFRDYFHEKVRNKVECADDDISF